MTSRAGSWKHRFPGRSTPAFHDQYTPDFTALVAGDVGLQADLVQLMKRALEGSVRDTDCVCFDLGRATGEHVHEVGLNIVNDHYRIYFADPACEPAKLLFLLPSWKPSSKVSTLWRKIQDGHIAEAKTRCGDWISGWYRSRI